jgi:hypothetical protein
MEGARIDRDFSLLACAIRLGDILQKVSNFIHDKIIPKRLSPDMITAISLRKSEDGLCGKK